MNMIEKVARAMFKADFPDSEWRPTEDGYMRMARAAIEAMREPTNIMCLAALRFEDEDGDGKVDWPMAQKTWRAMIDAALNEKGDA